MKNTFVSLAVNGAEISIIALHTKNTVDQALGSSVHSHYVSRSLDPPWLFTSSVSTLYRPVSCELIYETQNLYYEHVDRDKRFGFWLIISKCIIIFGKTVAFETEMNMSFFRWSSAIINFIHWWKCLI